MTLPASGVLSVQAINTELLRRARAPFDINGAIERSLAGVPTGQIKFSDFYGKSFGFPTPQASYANPNAITLSTPSVPTLSVSLTFNSDGTITVGSGTPTTAFPAKWFQNTTPPPGYQILFSARPSVWAGDYLTTFYSSNNPSWQDLSSSPSILVSVSRAVPIVQTTYNQVTYDVYLSDGATTIVTFVVTLLAQIT